MKRGFIATSIVDFIAYLVYVLLLIIFLVVFKVAGFGDPAIQTAEGIKGDVTPLHFLDSQINDKYITDYLKETFNKCDENRKKVLRALLQPFIIWENDDSAYSFIISKGKKECSDETKMDVDKYNSKEKSQYVFPDYDGLPMKLKLTIYSKEEMKEEVEHYGWD